MSDTSSSDTQDLILQYAIDYTEGRIEWFPPHVHGAARNSVLQALFNRGLAKTDGHRWFVAQAGYEAVGRRAPQPVPPNPFEEIDRLLAQAQAVWELEHLKPTLHEPVPVGGSYAQRSSAPPLSTSDGGAMDEKAMQGRGLPTEPGPVSPSPFSHL
ncbi:hypothetical protein OOT46_30315 [Aquabacterium sp. A7-Y]|uniref:hypothetical protein n=1 Tax=Aquabacterium sp. A7-Y TaxID=1349605 RepID=UPI00223E87A7|nr:hypothetical protein [Aquabacterium sp. A7-Y]MCW7542093.1 hypothetical protein [Aquabacterium sp. A7-Y]